MITPGWVDDMFLCHTQIKRVSMSITSFGLGIPPYRSSRGEMREMEKKSEREDHKGKVCKRCKESYRVSSDTSSSCRFHPSFFVCRRHDDQKRYYELGPNDPPYAAKFYDCCGAEDPEASGCTTSFHVSYDDD